MLHMPGHDFLYRRGITTFRQSLEATECLDRLRDEGVLLHIAGKQPPQVLFELVRCVVQPGTTGHIESALSNDYLIQRCFYEEAM